MNNESILLHDCLGKKTLLINLKYPLGAISASLAQWYYQKVPENYSSSCNVTQRDYKKHETRRGIQK